MTVNPSSRILGVDFGIKRIGIAAGNTRTGTAQPLGCIVSNKNGPDWQKFEKLICEWRPSRMVVGLPLSMDGSESEMSALARQFGAELSERFSIAVEYMDERLTSRAADQIIQENTPEGKKRKCKNSGLRDSIAAQLIVESYMKENRGYG